MARTRTRKRWPSERFVPIATARRRGKGGAVLLLWHRFTPQQDAPTTDHGIGTAPGEWYVATRPRQTFDEAFAIRAADLVHIRKARGSTGLGAPCVLRGEVAA